MRPMPLGNEIDEVIDAAKAGQTNDGYYFMHRDRVDSMREDLLRVVRRHRRRKLRRRTELAVIVAGEMNAPDPYSV